MSSANVLTGWRILSQISSNQSRSYVTTDGQSASLSWNKAPIWGLRPVFYYCHTIAGLLMWGFLSHERTGLSFTMYNVPIITPRHGPGRKHRSCVCIQCCVWSAIGADRAEKTAFQPRLLPRLFRGPCLATGLKAGVFINHLHTNFYIKLSNISLINKINILTYVPTCALASHVPYFLDITIPKYYMEYLFL
jgi:hypothetical protein